MKSVSKIAATLLGSLLLAAPAWAQSATASGKVNEPQNSKLEKQRVEGSNASGHPTERANQPYGASGNRRDTTGSSQR